MAPVAKVASCERQEELRRPPDPIFPDADRRPPSARTLVVFFPSRSRHTRSLCDWSSDVCSSDLPLSMSHDRYDAIVLDIDNGPTAMVQQPNARLYNPKGIRLMMMALKPGGRAAIWSAAPEIGRASCRERV